MVAHLVSGDVGALGIEAEWSNALGTHVQVFVVFATPPFVVQVQERLSTLCLDLQFDRGVAPDVFSVQNINFFTWFDVFDLMLKLPQLMILHPLLVPFHLRFFFIALSVLAFDHELDGVVDDFRTLQNPLSNVFPTVWALPLSNQTLIDALLTE